MTSLREEAKRLEIEKQEEEARERRFGEAVRAVAATPDGKVILGWIIREGDLFTDAFSPSSALPYAEGKRFVARMLWDVLRRHANRADAIEICFGEENHG